MHHALVLKCVKVRMSGRKNDPETLTTRERQRLYCSSFTVCFHHLQYLVRDTCLKQISSLITALGDMSWLSTFMLLHLKVFLWVESTVHMPTANGAIHIYLLNHAM